jgi:hypothetical protein
MIKMASKPIRVNKSSQDKKTQDVGANLFVGNLDPDVDEKVGHSPPAALPGELLGGGLMGAGGWGGLLGWLLPHCALRHGLQRRPTYLASDSGRRPHSHPEQH